MAEYMKKASKNLQASQELQKQWHDQKAVLIQYQPGQKVWVLEPVAPRALQDKWSGPHIIVEKKGEVTYLVDLGTARSPVRVLHVNRLKPYYDRADLTLLMATDEGQEEESDPLPDLFSSTEQDALVEGVVLADCLTAEQKDHCINLLGQFSELFSTMPGTTSWYEHTIDTGDSLPVKSKIYRQPDHVRDCIKQEVQKMLELGVVEHSESPWASPVVLVPKPHSKDGKKEMRFCVDYRGLNQVTKTDAHPIPKADELIDTLASAKYLSTLDLTAGYWQIKLSEDAKAKTAFSTIGGHYQSTVMPFGLKNASSTFQRVPVEQGDQVQKVTSKSEMGRCPGNASCGCKEASTGQKKLRFLKELKGLETSPLVDGSLSPRRVVQKCFFRRKDANKPCYTQIVRLAFLDAAGAQEGPGGRKLDLQREGTSSKTKNPHGSR
ncbi:hypothetical protein NDU88_005018 [Pleurodeles waltl]|uniref:ribonuclease H n=1 Tax=Pleurodeles waltl TaxID=8319 RepID=A0AAV7PGU6_PLEWA|nr:hypothetical protein NDU88_005018 [Pleurodeles waltl]